MLSMLGNFSASLYCQFVLHAQSRFPATLTFSASLYCMHSPASPLHSPCFPAVLLLVLLRVLLLFGTQLGRAL